MARIRSTKPEFWSDRKLATRVSRDARLLYMALWNFADEHGRLHGDARYVKGNCFPYDDDLSLGDIDRLLADLEAAERIQQYDHDGDPYIYLPKLAGHQRLEAEKVPSRLPAPPDPRVTPTDPGPGAGTNPGESVPRTDESAPGVDESSLLYVAGGREQVAGSRGVALRADTAPIDDLTGQLLIEHVRAYDRPPPQVAQSAVKAQIMRLVAEHVEPDRIRAGLARLREKRLPASLLPELVSEATPVKGSTTDSRVAAGLALVARYEAEEAL